MADWENLAKRHGFDEEPTKIGLLVLPTSETDPPVVIIRLFELTDETIVVGLGRDDIFLTTFDRFSGLGIDNGRLAKMLIPASELRRIEAFAAKGAYAKPAPSAPVAPADVPFDPDSMM